jgi:hypothetical protein
MTTDPQAGLIEALQHFLRDARRAVEKDLRRSGPQRPSVQAFARSLTALPACTKADAAARTAATATGYLLPEQADAPAARPGAKDSDPGSGSKVTALHLGSSGPPGRPLDADCLISTGVAGMLLDGAELDLEAVAQELAGYLAGPPIDIWEYVIVDASLTLDDPIPVIDGWELTTPNADELRRLLPLPSTALYQPARPFDPDDYGGLTMLRRHVPDATPDRGHIAYIYWDFRPEYTLWEPLLALGLYMNAVVQSTAQYRIEPRRRADKMFDRVQWEPWSPEDGIVVDRPYKGEFHTDADGVGMLRRFLDQLAPLLSAALSTSANKKAIARLRRCAEHFLSAGEHAHGEGEVLPERNPDAVLHYVIALEGLLAGDDPDRGDFTRKVGQRAAVLAGENDTQRLDIEKLVREAYRARSAYAHGSEPDEIDLPKLRRIVRRCLLTRLVVGDPTADGPLYKLADGALLSHDRLQRYIRQPFGEFAQRVRSD